MGGVDEYAGHATGCGGRRSERVLAGYEGNPATGLPTFSRGSYAQDQGYRGKVVDFRVGIETEGVAIVPGDIVFGDADGVIAIPQDAAQEAISRALEKVSQESAVRTAIVDGMSAVDAFEKFGVM